MQKHLREHFNQNRKTVYLGRANGLGKKSGKSPAFLPVLCLSHPVPVAPSDGKIRQRTGEIFRSGCAVPSIPSTANSAATRWKGYYAPKNWREISYLLSLGFRQTTAENPNPRGVALRTTNEKTPQRTGAYFRFEPPYLFQYILYNKQVTEGIVSSVCPPHVALEPRAAC